MSDEPVETPADDGARASDPDDPFVEIVQEALEDLPEQFAERLGNVAIRVVEWPDADDLSHQRRPGLLLGLYQGVPRTAENADLAMASRITVFRGPLTALFQRPEALRGAIREVVFHEVGHYFGISDERLDELEQEKWAAIHAMERG